MMSNSSSRSRRIVYDNCVVEGCKYADIDMWPLLSLVQSELRSKINLIYSFGPSATELVFTTTDNHVSLFVFVCAQMYQADRLYLII